MQPTQTQHTELPWSVNDIQDMALEIIGPIGSGAIVARIPEWGVASDDADMTVCNATFIVEACNNYERLQNINAQLLTALHTARNGLQWYNDECPQHGSEADNEAMQLIDAALAAAEGTP